VAQLHRLAPLVGQLVEAQSRLALERPLDAERRRGVHDRADHVVAPAGGDVLPEREAVAVGEELVRALGHLPDGRQRAVERRVAQPGVRLRVPVPERQELRHPLHEPERRVHLREHLQVGAGPPAREDVELELVHHLVHQHVLERLVVAGERLRHALAQRVRHAARALAQVAEHVALREVAAAREEDDRLLLAELVLEQPREPRVAALGHARRVHRRLALGRVVVDAEVLRLDDAPVEAVVLHEVLPEVELRPRRGRERGPDEGAEHERDERAEDHRATGTGRHGTRDPPPATPAPAAAAPAVAPSPSGTSRASPHSRSSW
jgi:hypothetical protein